MAQKNQAPTRPIFEVPSREDYFGFLIRCYFGDGEDSLQLCVRRAYLDLNRTLHGFAVHKRSEELRNSAHLLVAELVAALPALSASQRSFDSWHRKACSDIRGHYHEGGFDAFSHGQAQKWLNMTLKYVFAMGESRLPGYTPHYSFAHIPIDNVFVTAAKAIGGPDLPMPWSRLDDYSAYFRLQEGYREMFAPSAPLAAEFKLWLGGQ
jgi:hypothetical protein